MATPPRFIARATLHRHRCRAVGAVLTYLLLPLVNRLHPRMPRPLAILLVFGGD